MATPTPPPDAPLPGPASTGRAASAQPAHVAAAALHLTPGLSASFLGLQDAGAQRASAAAAAVAGSNTAAAAATALHKHSLSADAFPAFGDAALPAATPPTLPQGPPPPPRNGLAPPPEQQQAQHVRRASGVCGSIFSASLAPALLAIDACRWDATPPLDPAGLLHAPAEAPRPGAGGGEGPPSPPRGLLLTGLGAVKEEVEDERAPGLAPRGAVAATVGADAGVMHHHHHYGAGYAAAPQPLQRSVSDLAPLPKAGVGVGRAAGATASGGFAAAAQPWRSSSSAAAAAPFGRHGLATVGALPPPLLALLGTHAPAAPLPAVDAGGGDGGGSAAEHAQRAQDEEEGRQPEGEDLVSSLVRAASTAAAVDSLFAPRGDALTHPPLLAPSLLTGLPRHQSLPSAWGTQPYPSPHPHPHYQQQHHHSGGSAPSHQLGVGAPSPLMPAWASPSALPAGGVGDALAPALRGLPAGASQEVLPRGQEGAMVVGSGWVPCGPPGAAGPLLLGGLAAPVHGVVGGGMGWPARRQEGGGTVGAGPMRLGSGASVGGEGGAAEGRGSSSGNSSSGGGPEEGGGAGQRRGGGGGRSSRGLGGHLVGASAEEVARLAVAAAMRAGGLEEGVGGGEALLPGGPRAGPYEAEAEELLPGALQLPSLAQLLQLLPSGLEERGASPLPSLGPGGEQGGVGGEAAAAAAVAAIAAAAAAALGQQPAGGAGAGQPGVLGGPFAVGAGGDEEAQAGHAQGRQARGTGGRPRGGKAGGGRGRKKKGGEGGGDPAAEQQGAAEAGGGAEGGGGGGGGAGKKTRENLPRESEWSRGSLHAPSLCCWLPSIGSGASANATRAEPPARRAACVCAVPSCARAQAWLCSSSGCTRTPRTRTQQRRKSRRCAR